MVPGLMGPEGAMAGPQVEGASWGLVGKGLAVIPCWVLCPVRPSRLAGRGFPSLGSHPAGPELWVTPPL